MNETALAERTTVGEIMEQTGPLPAVAPEGPVAFAENPEGYATLMHIIERAANNPVLDLDRLQKLLDLKTAWETRQAEKAYYAAVSAFKLDPPTIVKNKSVSFPHKTGGDKTEYRHATLDECVNKIVPALSRHGLSHRWDVEYEGDQIKVTCTLRHRLGFSEKVTMKAGRDTSGQKNNLQEQASTITYLERYTILAITGLAAANQDDDGISAEDRDAENKTLRITEEQKEILIGLQIETQADTKRFLAHFKIDSLDDMPKGRFDEAKRLLEAKRSERSKPAASDAPASKRGLLD